MCQHQRRSSAILSDMHTWAGGTNKPFPPRLSGVGWEAARMAAVFSSVMFYHWILTLRHR